MQVHYPTKCQTANADKGYFLLPSDRYCYYLQVYLNSQDNVIQKKKKKKKHFSEDMI